MSDEHGDTKIVGMIIAVIIVLTIGVFWSRFAGEAADVTQEELGPRALLKKYQWFKDASAQLDKKRADMKVYDERFKRLEDQYKSVPRTEWAREDREQYNLWSSECAGIRASYNSLAAEYNAAMSKINWRFCNKGDLPQGADEPLPREYKPYVTE